MRVKKFKIITMGWYPDKLSVLFNKKIIGTPQVYCFSKDYMTV